MSGQIVLKKASGAGTLSCMGNNQDEADKIIWGSEPAGTRIQGPRLKSSKERVLTSARYGSGLPIIPCNIEMLVHSIGSIHSRRFPSIPAEF